MARSLIFPGANQSRRYDGRYPGVVQRTVSKLILHSTETAKEWGAPGYGGGAAAPTLTICPWTRRVWQHFPVTVSARALLNPSSTYVSENRDNVAQIEIIGYSDQNIAKKYGSDLRTMGDREYAFIASVVKWFITEWDVSNRYPSRWPSYPSSYGNSPARMSSSEYDRFRGWLAHLHVSGNDHGDITLDPDRLARHIGGASVPVHTGSEWTPTGDYTTKQIQKIVGVTVDGDYGPATTAAVLELQEDLGVTADGLWGRATETAYLESQGKPVSKVPGKPADDYWTPTSTYSVRKIQKIAGATVDGYYGDGTKEAVADLQRRLGVKADGYFGPATEAAYEKSKKKSGGKKLAVDGIEGRATVKALQRFLGVTADGIRGRSTNRAMQKWLGVTQDGIVGERTVSALQRKVGAPVDGRLGPATIKHLQRYLNRH